MYPPTNLTITVSAVLLITALILGAVPIIVRKGKSLHKTFGKLFFMVSVLAAISATYIGLVIFESDLMALSSIATIFVGLTGVRAIRMKRPDKKDHHKPQLLDWGIAIVFLIVCLYFFVAGLIKPRFLSEVTSLVSVIFASLSLFDFHLFTRTFVKVKHRMSWLYKHLGRMLIGYGLVITVLTQLMSGGRPSIMWIFPLVLTLVVIAIFSRIYQMKYEG